jgi:hypothetical protein
VFKCWSSSKVQINITSSATWRVIKYSSEKIRN